MFSVKRNLPPEYASDRDIRDNFERFFDWGLGLKNPRDQIPKIGDELGFGVRRHPIGFLVVYLSRPSQGILSDVWGSVRADIFPVGVEYEDDIHCHGFDFFSGVVAGGLRNTRHYPNWQLQAPDGEGYIGYESSVDLLGVNETIQATDAIVVIERSEAEVLESGDTYTMVPRTDFHSVSTDEGAVTIFCKTPTYDGHNGLALVLRKPDSEAPPLNY